MSSDISRQRFNPAKQFTGVLQQQGRVQLDADWNEWNDILNRRWRSETIDLIGRGVVPRETPDGFAIALSGTDLTIGRGRIYVDGLQAENHGAGDLEFDRVLGESRGVDPLPYKEQPYYPGAPDAPKEGGPHLVYLDVWEREVTSVEDSELIESAVGIDTTSRLQTVWQVRVLPGVGAGASCATPDEQLPGWLEIIAPSDGRLTTAAVGVAAPDDPCQIPPSGGYRGLENRTYRVEIHDAGPVGKATFKWSRDNASVATNISKIEGDNLLTVDRTAWDSVRRFSPGDWIEITDDVREFSLGPGEIRRIATVDDASLTITLEAPLPAGVFAADGANHARIKRWDQGGIVRDSKGATYVDLNAAASPGLIEVPPAGTSLILEDGVEVTFTTAIDGGAFRAGDYWIFAARTADASVEELDAAPPRGVHHHYCRLAVVTFPDPPVDCRVFWPPLVSDAASCECTLCVSADQHNEGTFTIYETVNQILTTGGTICLGPGVFNLVETPVQLANAFGVRIRGQGAATVVIQPRADAAFVITKSQWCTLEKLTIQSIGATSISPAIRLGNSVGTTIESVTVSPPDEGNGPSAGIELEAGFLLETNIRHNFLKAQNGVIFAPEDNKEGALVLGTFYCTDNTLQSSNTGVRLGGLSYYLADTVVARNFITSTGMSGISITGFAFLELDITGNTITPSKGDGIVIGTGGARVSDNEITNAAQGAQHGIRLIPGLTQTALAPIVISQNRLTNLTGNGLSIETPLVSALVAHNVLSGIAGNGLLMLPGSSAGSFKVLSNQFIGIGASAPALAGGSQEIAGIFLRGVFEGAVSDNIISEVGLTASTAAVIAGVRVDSCLDVRISDNTITNIAPAVTFVNPAAGVLVNGPIVNIDIADNLIRRQITPNDTDVSPWAAIRILGIAGQQSISPGLATISTLSTLGRISAVGTLAAAAAAPLNEQAGITGNTMHGYGRGPLGQVVVTGSCRFNGNQCFVIGQQLGAAVTLSANAIIAGNNRIECATDRMVALALATGNDKNLFAVTGNITGGPITVNGGQLSAPWQALNVVGT